MDEPQKEVSRSQAVLRHLDEHLSPPQRAALVEWARQLLSIRSVNEQPLEKARRAIAATYRREVIVALLSGTASSVKDLAWSDRSWSARLGLGAAAVAATTLGGKGAGIAAMGSAIGVPLWVVFGAGGSFAGMLIDELSKAMPRQVNRDSGIDAPKADSAIVEGEWEFLELPAPPEGGIQSSLESADHVDHRGT